MRRGTKITLAILTVVFLFFGTVGYLFLFGDGALSPKVQVIPVRGVISVSGQASSQQIVEQIAAADGDSTVKAIILEINSPGGNVVATEEIARAVEYTNKPVIAWIREVGASGAYWIASSSDFIVAERASMTGSIGVSASYLQYADWMDEEGITYERLVTGKYKDAGSPFKDLEPDERSMFQEKINKINGMFINHIAQARDMESSYVRDLANGEIYLGIEAKENGLADEVGGKEVAFEVAKQLSGDDEVILSEARRGGLFGRFLSAKAYWLKNKLASGAVRLSSAVNQFTA